MSLYVTSLNISVIWAVVSGFFEKVKIKAMGWVGQIWFYFIFSLLKNLKNVSMKETLKLAKI